MIQLLSVTGITTLITTIFDYIVAFIISRGVTSYLIYVVYAFMIGALASLFYLVASFGFAFVDLLKETMLLINPQILSNQSNISRWF